jgi:hypothetical protein
VILSEGLEWGVPDAGDMWHIRRRTANRVLCGRKVERSAFFPIEQPDLPSVVCRACLTEAAEVRA